MLIIVTAGLGAWPASYVVASETSSLRLRSKTQGVGWLLGGGIGCGFGFGVPYLYNSDAADLGGKVGFIFLGLSALGVLITWFLVPELKGLTAVDIDRVFEKNVPVRRANTAQWEALPNEDEMPLRQLTTSGSDGSTYDAASTQSSRWSRACCAERHIRAASEAANVLSLKLASVAAPKVRQFRPGAV